MKLLSYHGTRPGIVGLGNRLIRLRLRGKYSHNEVMFEPGDGVDAFMPDGTCQPDEAGAYWCVSSAGTERIPGWSLRRPGKIGGVRFKRILPDPARWTIRNTKSNPVAAAVWAKENEGRPYDWSLVFGYIAWVIPNKVDSVLCSEAGAEMLGIPDAWRFDPCSLDAAVVGLQKD